eukprot:1159959-Pelagomonas_calceolata.AAC.4
MHYVSSKKAVPPCALCLQGLCHSHRQLQHHASKSRKALMYLFLQGCRNHRQMPQSWTAATSLNEVLQHHHASSCSLPAGTPPSWAAATATLPSTCGTR